MLQEDAQELRALLDREAIRQLPINYCHYVRTRDVDAILDMYTPDGVFDVPPSMAKTGVLSGREEIRRIFDESLESMDPWPFTHNHVVEMIDGSHARGFVYTEFRLGSEHLRLGFVGVYHDEYVKVSQTWKFAARRLQSITITDGADQITGPATATSASIESYTIAHSFMYQQQARNEITDVLMRLCRGVDRLDRELIISCYHPNAIDDHGSFRGSARQFADWIFSTQEGLINSCVHHLGNILMQIEGDVANTESYVLAYHRQAINGVPHDHKSHGRYLDRFERRGGVWKIAHRLVVFDWDRLDPVERQWTGPLTTELVRGLRSRHDASYETLGSRE